VLPLWLSTGRCLSSTSRRCRGRGCWSRCTSRWRSRSAIASRRWSGRRPQSLARARAATMRCVRMQPRNHATTQPRNHASVCPQASDRFWMGVHPRVHATTTVSTRRGRSRSRANTHSVSHIMHDTLVRAVASPHCRATATAFAFARCVCPHVSAGVSMRVHTTYVHDASPAGGCGLASAGADTMKTHLILLSHFYTE
jgi:hypothetical protein